MSEQRIAAVCTRLLMASGCLWLIWDLLPTRGSIVVAWIVLIAVLKIESLR